MHPLETRRQQSTPTLLVAWVLLGLTSTSFARTQTASRTQAGSSARSGQETDAPAEDELRKGTTLTRRGEFSEAIPHLLAAQGRGANDYGVNFNLALCYVGTNQFGHAIEILAALRAAGHDNADVNNLLAQAYVGQSEDTEAFAALEKAVSFTPTNEKLYLFVADACMGKQDYELGLRVVGLGLKHLPQSAWLHYERGMFLSLLDQFDSGKSEFGLAHSIAPDADVAFIAATEQAILEGNLKQAVEIARQGIRSGHQHFLLETLLGKALLRSGITPGRQDFEEAQDVLEKSTAEHPNDPASQLALGELYILAGRLDEAIVHLELARRLNPSDTSVYAHLAVAYRRQGKVQKAQDVLNILAQLNQRQAAKIRTAPGERKMGYGETTTGARIP